MTHHTDLRALILRMADELDHARQLYLDDRTAKCPLAAEARAALSAAPQQPSDEWIEWLREDHAISKDDAADFANAVRKAVRLYGGQAVPVPITSSDICTGCNTPRHEAIAAIANGAMACCPDCSTLTVEDRNAIRAIKAALTPQQQEAMDALEHILKHSTTNLGEAKIRRAIMGGEA